MAAHVSTDQIINHIKSVKKISVDGIIYENFSIDDKNIIVDKYTFPLDYFDIGGMDPNSLILVATDHEYHRVQFHDENNVTLDHPEWKIEEYNANKIRNSDIGAIAHKSHFTK